ncbi:GtrA family protein [Rhabdothermincola sp.]|uniref:GtrA family protein n=1 Tax=Rhabdothermincola sp. TaxID=2820405 RepID=UPI002FE32C46
MAASTTALQDALQKVRTHGLKYSAVSVINVIVGQGLLVFFSAILGLRPAPSNVLAVCISAVPAYYLSRAWVWGKSGKSHLTKEVLPFWGFALAGLVLSTGAVWTATHVTGIADIPVDQRSLVEKLVPNVANIVAFGVLWVVKFFVLDAYMFGRHHHGPVDGLDGGLDEPAPA